ncbi:MAG TPA: hypothetical protein VLA61_28025 [Ideonella sp.]|uniref:hypothetical protein n=1 Tax=Ideonella sp. TaxID=1929293 RepID=UPI002BDCB9FF|nr:hypothetical protein [Ideonella sp.]HSI52133.1 hypothetical protein [Ideonella sp.]
MSTATLLLSVLFGAIGSGYFLYGRKQRAVVPLLCGLALIVMPYFIPNAALLVVAGVAVSAIPYFYQI